MFILDAVEASLKDFVPKNHRQFIVLNIARKFQDLQNLARYLNVCDHHPRKVLLEAARLAVLHSSQDSRPAKVWFFELLGSWGRKEAT